MSLLFWNIAHIRNDILGIPQPKPKFSQNAVNFSHFKLLMLQISSGIPQNDQWMRNCAIRVEWSGQHSTRNFNIRHMTEFHTKMVQVLQKFKIVSWTLVVKMSLGNPLKTTSFFNVVSLRFRWRNVEQSSTSLLNAN